MVRKGEVMEERRIFTICPVCKRMITNVYFENGNYYAQCECGVTLVGEPTKKPITEKDIIKAAANVLESKLIHGGLDK